MKHLIEEIVMLSEKQFKKTNILDLERIFFKISKKYNFKIVDGYGSLRGILPDSGEFFIPNSYGQEDAWNQEILEFDFVILLKKEVIIVRYFNDEYSVNHVFFDVKIDFNDFGGKRGYYLHKDLVRFRTTKDFYDTLKPENKYPKGEKDLSGPHFTIRF